MPAYFNISLQFERKDIYESFMKDFYSILNEYGMKFKSGYGGAEDDSFEVICECNQRKLEDNFKLGFTEHYSHDFKQVLFDFGEYSHVRGFWLNQYPDEDTFSFEIVIPEDEVLVEEGKAIFRREKIEELLALSKKLWQFPYARTIQTGLEAMDASTGIADLLNGLHPNVTPFSMIEEKYNCFDNREYQVERISRDGIVLEKMRKEKERKGKKRKERGT